MNIFSKEDLENIEEGLMLVRANARRELCDYDEDTETGKTFIKAIEKNLESIEAALDKVRILMTKYIRVPEEL